MKNLEARLKKLEDESDIRRLKAVYLNACDRKDVETIRACFTEDAEIIYPPIGSFGVDGLINVFTQMAVETPITDVHQAHNGVITINGDDATADWNLSFASYDPVTKGFRLLATMYVDKYRRTDQGWLICYTESQPRAIVDGQLTQAGLQAEWVDPS